MIQTHSPAQAKSILSTAFGSRTLVVFQGCGFSAPHRDRSVSHQTNPDVILSEAKDLSRNPGLTPTRSTHHPTLSFRAKRRICFLSPHQAHSESTHRAKLVHVCAPPSQTQKLVILSEAKDLSRKYRRAPSAVRGASQFPISVFQFPFSTQSGGTAKP
jgi:hypothetical protein